MHSIDLKTAKKLLTLYEEATEQQSHPLHLEECSIEGCKSYWLSDNRDIDAYLNCETMVSCEWNDKCLTNEHFCNKHAGDALKTLRHKMYNITNLVCPACFKDFLENPDPNLDWYYARE